jgi:serine/threonine-protein kinase
MPLASIDDLAAAIRQGHLLDDSHREQAEQLLARGGDPRGLARELVRLGWLTPFQVNELFLGRGNSLTLGGYVLLDKLGEGGMGVVFKARHQNLGRIVAVKIIRKDHLTKPEAVRRFRREMRAVAQLDHPNLVRAFDADDIDGRHFLVMEFVEGVTLSRRVKDQGPLAPALACHYIHQAALGLQHAFERGLIHRDIKPSNLILTKAHGGASAAVVKVLDLGLARFGCEFESLGSSTDLTREGMAIGTADFMAPEQSQDAHAVDIRADVYSLGCTLYFLLSGRPPFPGGSVVDKMLRHRYDTPPRLSAFQAAISPCLLEVLDQLLAKEPANRFQTPAEVAQALGEPDAMIGEIAGFTPVQAARAPIDESPVDTPNVFRDIDVETALLPAPPRRTRRRTLVILGVCLAGLMMGLLLLLILRLW